MPPGRTFVVVVLATAFSLAVGASVPAAPTPPGLRILVFSKTAGFRHDSIPTALEAVRRLGTPIGMRVDATEDAAAFSSPNLGGYDVVVFLLTTGDVLDERQQAALQRFVRAGGGYVGVHSASDTEHDWPWYGGLVGAYFRTHPAIQRATVTVAEPRDLSTRRLPQRWVRTDEWYGFVTNPRRSVRVLATLDESSYAPGDSAMGTDHPIAWSHRYDGGRAWYTAGGHTSESYSEPSFRAHLLGGILWAAGPPRISSVRGVVRDRRLVVTVRQATPRRIRGELRVRVRGRALVTPLVFEGTTARARSPVLPAGSWAYTVVLEDRTNRLDTTVQRRARVP